MAAGTATIALVDEVEYGLEPHRLTRLLDSLGAKDPAWPLQVFMTSHSPVAVRELSGDQVCVVRAHSGQHYVLKVGVADDVQSTLRADPEAFLAKSVVVCEGASEVGLARGLDQFWVGQGRPSFFALGGAYVDVGGSNPDRCFTRGTALLRLGYRVLVFVDADKAPTPDVVAAYQALGGQTLTWRAGHALEDELFRSLSDGAIDALLEKAIEVVGRDLVDAHIASKSNGQRTLNAVELDRLREGHSDATKELLGTASRIRGAGWFKSLSTYQEVALNIVGPDLATAEAGFQAIVEQLRAWTHAA